MKKQNISIALAALAGLAIVTPVFAQDINASNTSNVSSSSSVSSSLRGMMRTSDGDNDDQGVLGGGRRIMARSAVFGTVTAINGSIITVSGQQGFNNGSSTAKALFTIDATNAKFIKNNTTSTLAGILVGDTISAQGTTTGNNVVATVIRDGNMVRGLGRVNSMMNNKNQALAQLQGNGQPIIAGTVSTVSSTTLTLTNKSNVTYTVDISAAKITVKNVVASSSLIGVGDSIFVQGSINGTSITAATVIDSGLPVTATSTQNNQSGRYSRGFFGGMMGFFSRLFGF